MREWIVILSGEARLRIVRLLVEEYGTPTNAAIAAGISKSAITKYMKGQLIPGNTAMEKIIRALHGVYREKALKIAYNDVYRRLRILEKELQLLTQPSR